MTAARYTLIDTLPQPSVLGESSTAAFQGLAFIDINPASVAGLSRTEYTLMHNIWFQGVNNERVSVGRNFDFGAGALSFSYFDMGTVQKIGMDEFGAPVPTSEQAELYAMSFSAAAAKKIRSLLLGLGVDVIYEALDDDRQAYLSFAAGAVQKNVLVDNLDVGLSVLNISFDTGDVTMPLEIKAGAGYTVKNSGEEILKAGLGACYMPDNDMTLIELGAQYAIFPALAIRAGTTIDTRGSAAVNAGFGVKLDDFRIDYAYSPAGELGSTHKIAISGVIGSSAELKITDDAEDDGKEEAGEQNTGNTGWGDYYYRKKQFSKALRYYEKANLLEWKKIEDMTDGEKSSFYQKLGICYYNIRDNDRAKQYFEKAYFYDKTNEILKHWIRIMKESGQ